MDNTVLFSGCSYTFGDGFDLNKNESGLWVNLLHKEFFKKLDLVNISTLTELTNHSIFVKTLNFLLDNNPKFAFVQWTSYPRYRIQLGIDNYSANIVTFSPSKNLNDLKTNIPGYPLDYLNSVKNRFLMLHHPHYGILEIINYINILIKLCNLKKIKIFFINGLCHWDENYFTFIDNQLPDNYTKYTKKILDTKNKTNNEILELYNKIHSDYTQLGSIQAPYWLNLYQSMMSSRIDTNSDNFHPGLKSNQLFFERFSLALLNNLDTKSTV